jgi:hypothetical protein
MQTSWRHWLALRPRVQGVPLCGAATETFEYRQRDARL